MPITEAWWLDSPTERYWLESTDRPDIGADLKAPLADESGEENWRYTLFQYARPGDLVFHYDKNASAVTGVSRISGKLINTPIVWAARGSYARERHAVPVEVPGYRMELSDFTPLAQPLTLDDIRQKRPELDLLCSNLLRKHRALYFPFELGTRPVRPLQGYAFKLPQDFIHLFPQLSGAVGEAQQAVVSRDIELFERAIRDVEAAASQYAFGKLQVLRAKIHGYSRVPKRLFGPRKPNQTWVFHYGGRGELQFSVGIDVMADGSPAFRSGVAFSFETSRSLTDINVFLPKVARFNAWIRENAEALGDLSMWAWQGGTRTPDFLVGAIDEGLFRRGTFVVLASRQSLNMVDASFALETFDRLLPLFEWVETKAPLDEYNLTAPGPLIHGQGRKIDGGRWIQATFSEKTLNIYLRHREIQRRLESALYTEGYTNVRSEVQQGSCFIDTLANNGSEIWLFEVKTAPTVRRCIREALGQLLEYALWPGAVSPSRLVVVGEPAMNGDAVMYLEKLNSSLPIQLSYRQLCLDD